MSIQIISDLHLEAPKAYDIFEIVPRAPVLALLGDIGNVKPHQDDLCAFLARQLSQFQAVLFVPGNHEAYHATWPETLAILQSFARQCQARRRDDARQGDFVLLDRNVYRLPSHPGTVVLGCSLFSWIPPEQETALSMGLNDFFHDDRWDVAAHNRAHKRDLAWLNETVAALDQSATDVQSILVFTHWSPSRDARTLDPRHGGSPITSGFATDLSQEACFQAAKVKVWAFGHTHYNCDIAVERETGCPLRLVTNQRGYYFAQAQGYDNDKTLSV